MNKQEIIEKIKMMTVETLFSGTLFVKQPDVIKLIEQLDEPEKVKVPQFVANWIEKSKTVASGTLKGAYINAPENVRMWWNGDNIANVRIFARAWLDGYEVEEEKRYRVKLKSNSEEIDYLVNTERNGLRFYSTKRRKHTRKELEEAGFGWVFDCPGIEIEEVEDE